MSRTLLFTPLFVASLMNLIACGSSSATTAPPVSHSIEPGTAAGPGAAHPGAASPPSGAPADPIAVATNCANVPRPPAGPPPRYCTEMACIGDQYALDLEPDAAWPAGRYTFDVEADGRHQQCQGTLPLRACGTPNITCTGDSLATIGESGCALPAAQHAFGGVEISGTPCNVHITVKRDGNVVGEMRATPTYRWVFPNGPGCGGDCLQTPRGSLTLAL